MSLLVVMQRGWVKLKTALDLHGVEHPCVNNEKELWKLPRIVHQNLWQDMLHLTTQYNGGLCKSVSKDTVQRTLLDMILCNKCTSRVPLFTKYQN